MRVSIAGASGYAGGELLRLFESHPDFEVVAAAAHSSVGARVDSVHPALAPSSVGSLEFCPASADQLQADVVFIALPHGQSALLSRRASRGEPTSDDCRSWRRFQTCQLTRLEAVLRGRARRNMDLWATRTRTSARNNF